MGEPPYIDEYNRYIKNRLIFNNNSRIGPTHPPHEYMNFVNLEVFLVQLRMAFWAFPLASCGKIDKRSCQEKRTRAADHSVNIR